MMVRLDDLVKEIGTRVGCPREIKKHPRGRGIHKEIDEVLNSIYWKRFLIEGGGECGLIAICKKY